MHKPPLDDFFQTLALYNTLKNIIFGAGFVTALLLLAYVFIPKLR